MILYDALLDQRMRLSDFDGDSIPLPEARHGSRQIATKRTQRHKTSELVWHLSFSAGKGVKRLGHVPGRF